MTFPGLADAAAEIQLRALHWTSPARLFDKLIALPFYRDLLYEQAKHGDFVAGSSILELGCGPGALGAVLEDGCFHLTGCDRSKAMLRRARSKRKKRYIRLVWGEADCLPFGASSFDGAFAANLLPLVNEPTAALEELGRVLIPGASLVVAGPGEGFTPRTADQLIERDDRSALERAALRLWARSKRRLGAEAVRDLLVEASFVSVSVKHHLDGTMFSVRAVRS